MSALLNQFQVLRALVLRETRTRFGNHRLGYLWALVEPVTLVATFAAMFILLGRSAAGGMPVIPFLATGFLPYMLFRETAQRAVAAINSNKGLLFYPDIRPLDLVVARALLEVATYLVVFALIMGTVAVQAGGHTIDSITTMLLGLLLAAGVGVSLGLVLCSLSTFFNTVERLIGPLLRPLFWVSALFFSTNDVPSNVREIMLWNPILHAVELTRDGWQAGYHVRQVTPWYPAAWILVLLFFGLTLERVARRRLELT